MNFRMLPPADMAKRTVTYSGPGGAPFTFTAQDGRPLDAPEEFAECLAMDGWAAICPSGPTAARPTETVDCAHIREPGALFFDADLQAFIAWDGAVWRDAVAGKVV